MMKEFNQLDKGVIPGKPVVEPVDPNTLTTKCKNKALEAVNSIKEKHDIRIKGSTCENSIKQWKYLKEGETVELPTVSLEVLFMNLLIVALEEIYKAIFDVLGLYLNSDILLRLLCDFIDIVCEVNLEHNKNVIYENEQKVLYFGVVRVIYRFIE